MTKITKEEYEVALKTMEKLQVTIDAYEEQNAPPKRRRRPIPEPEPLDEKVEDLREKVESLAVILRDLTSDFQEHALERPDRTEFDEDLYYVFESYHHHLNDLC